MDCQFLIHHSVLSFTFNFFSCLASSYSYYVVSTFVTNNIIGLPLLSWARHTSRWLRDSILIQDSNTLTLVFTTSFIFYWTHSDWQSIAGVEWAVFTFDFQQGGRKIDLSGGTEVDLPISYLINVMLMSEPANSTSMQCLKKWGCSIVLI